MAFCFTNLAPGSAVIADLPQLHDGMQAVWHFFETGGWYMVPILICSLVAVMVVFMKFIDLRRSFIAPVELDRKLSEVEDLVATGRLEEITALAQLFPVASELGGTLDGRYDRATG